MKADTPSSTSAMSWRRHSRSNTAVIVDAGNSAKRSHNAIYVIDGAVPPQCRRARLIFLRALTDTAYVPQRVAHRITAREKAEHVIEEARYQL